MYYATVMPTRHKLGRKKVRARVKTEREKATMKRRKNKAKRLAKQEQEEK